jgi:hypothetical protein
MIWISDKERVMLNSRAYPQVAGHGLARLVVERDSLCLPSFTKNAYHLGIIWITSDAFGDFQIGEGEPGQFTRLAN